MIEIKQGYPETIIGKLDITKSGWFFYPNKNCSMIHESTIKEINKIINSHNVQETSK